MRYGYRGLSRERLLSALERTRWVISRTAALLKQSRQAVYDAMRKHGIDLAAAPPARRAAIRRIRSASGRAATKRSRSRAA